MIVQSVAADREPELWQKSLTRRWRRKSSHFCKDTVTERLSPRKEATANYAYLLRAASKDAGDGRNTFAPRILLAFVIHLQKQEDPFPSAQELHKVLDSKRSQGQQIVT